MAADHAAVEAMIGTPWGRPRSAAPSSSARRADLPRCSNIGDRSATRTRRPRWISPSTRWRDQPGRHRFTERDRCPRGAAGGLMHAPDTYLRKLIVGPQCAGHVSINDSAEVIIRTIADRLGLAPFDITVGHPGSRGHKDLSRRFARTGAADQLISDGDLTAASRWRLGTGVHAVIGHRRSAGGGAAPRRRSSAWRRDPGAVPVALRHEKERRSGHGPGLDDGTALPDR